MLYNVRIFGKRYRNKSKEDIYILLDKFASDINKTEFHTVESIKWEIVHAQNRDFTRLAFYDNRKVVVSFNTVK